MLKFSNLENTIKIDYDLPMRDEYSGFIEKMLGV